MYLWICKADNGQAFCAEVHFRGDVYDMDDNGLEVRFSFRHIRDEYLEGARMVARWLKPNQAIDISPVHLEMMPEDWTLEEVREVVNRYAVGGAVQS